MSTLTKHEPLASSTKLFNKLQGLSSSLGGFVTAIKHSRLAQLLVGLLAFQLLLSIVLAVQSSQQGNFASGEPLLSASADDISKIEISDAESAITLIRKSDKWLIDGDNQLPVQANKIENILDTVTTLKPGLPVASSEAARTQLKVADDDFMRRVSLSGDEMDTTTFILGTSPGLRKSHLRRADAGEIYSASLPTSDLPSDVNNWLDKGLLSFNNIVSVKSNNVRFTLTGENEDKAWSVSKPSDENRKIDTDKFEAVINALQSMRVIGVADAEPTTEADEPNEIVEVQIASDKPETKLTIEKKGDITTVKRDDIAGVFTLAATQFEQFSALAALEGFMIDDAAKIDEEADPEAEHIENSAEKSADN